MAGATASAPTSTALSPWTGTRAAAAELGMSSASLYRRIRYPHWIEGKHYRWIHKGARLVLQVNLPEAVQLIRRRGW